ncbi:MAG: hypothetical protein K9I94_12910 [Bacteroidales bacterium]|nr:hypothetical protein [Bacteroidales bacterium]
MAIRNRQQKYLELRKNYPWFAYESYNLEVGPNELYISFHFNLSGEYDFYPELHIPIHKGNAQHYRPEQLRNDPFVDSLIFNLGMIELISYWKAACPKRVLIKAGRLSKEQIGWWKNIYFNGLGEFFYVNGISASPSDFMHFEVEEAGTEQPLHFSPQDDVIVPVGGGKDSVVTMELVKKQFSAIPFIINPRGASLSTTKAAGYAAHEIFEIRRSIHPQLLELNDQGFLNGHTPFSAVVAFSSVLAAYLSNAKYIALSNESSANEATIEGTGINHQYSKTVSFEADFRAYVKQYLSPDIEYFSFLRPLNELQIARLFSRFTHHHRHFKSCNVGSKTDTWCGHCPKCLFTYIILSPFLDQQTLESIFHKNLFTDGGLIPIMEQLTGLAEEKPFECVGTLDEVNAALCNTIENWDKKELPAVLQHYRNSQFFKRCRNENFTALLKVFNQTHFLPKRFLKILKEEMG